MDLIMTEPSPGSNID
uniref:Uncharacterized protein n=1 Tax=Anguilla anguilla TaxID=7936 RepID=A0A0E9TN95_ANGAN